MILSVIIIGILAGVTYYHYVQGMFSSAISAFCAFIGVLIAFGYYEQLVGMAGQGKMADYAAGAVLITLFAATYILLRIVIDQCVPGNVEVPLYVERAGAGVFGFITALFCAGVFAVGAQLMPFGPSIGGYERFPTVSADEVSVPHEALGAGQHRDAIGRITNQLKDNDLEPTRSSGLLVPVDDFVISLTSVSSSNSLAGAQSFADVHPNLLDQAYANRLGPDHSGWRVFINSPKVPMASLNGVFTVSGNVEAADSEIVALRPNKSVLAFKAGSSDVILVLRATFANTAQDTDGVVRITPAAIRLVVGDKVYHPVGTMFATNKLGLSRLDDQILIPNALRAADFAFSIPKSLADTLSKAPAKGVASKAVGFVEFKMYSRTIVTAGMAKPYTGPSAEVGVLKKPAAPINGGPTTSR